MIELPLRIESVANKRRAWSEAEVAALRALYAFSDGPINLEGFAASLGRDKANVCRKARTLGLTNQRRRKVEERKPTRKHASDEAARAAIGAATRARFAAGGHPRGATGLKHTIETRAAISEKSKAAWRDPDSGHHSEARRQQASDRMHARNLRREVDEPYSRTRGGKRADLGGVYFRSAWEANYARFLNMLVAKGEIAGWAFEPKTFTFDHIKRGSRSYTPDFRVDLNGGGHEWHEVKGWMDAKSKTKLARMGRCYPSERVIVIDAKWFRSANKTLASLIPGWERGTVRS